mgnify:CR=1 FL=1
MREHLDSITSRRLQKLLDSADPNNNNNNNNNNNPSPADDSETVLTLSTLRFTISHAARRTGPTFHAVRAAFEAALSTTENPHSSFVEDITAHRYIYTSPPTTHTPDLWLQYLRLVARHAERELLRRDLGKPTKKKSSTKGGKDDRSKIREVKEVKEAKEVFYRAVAACPWVKEVYMAAFEEPLVGWMERGELKGVGEWIVKRGMRVCGDFEAMGVWDSRMGGEGR